MSLSKADFERLRSVAGSFGSKNHGHYLAEVMQCIRTTGDPVEALVLLRAMWASPYASRPEQKVALNDVGKWLEQLLGRDPKQTAETVSLQVGWLRRLTFFATAEQHGQNAATHRSSAGQPRDVERAFGDRIDGIRRRRQESVKADGEEARRPATPPPPQELPLFVAVRFRDFLAARDVRKKAKERAKKGKPANEILLDLVPIDERLAPLSVGLCCSTAQTDGFDALFLESEKRNNVPVPFFVTDITTIDGKRMAKKIALTEPFTAAT